MGVLLGPVERHDSNWPAHHANRNSPRNAAGSTAESFSHEPHAAAAESESQSAAAHTKPAPALTLRFKSSRLTVGVNFVPEAATPLEVGLVWSVLRCS